jgi:hypothetical protein
MSHGSPVAIAHNSSAPILKHRLQATLSTTTPRLSLVLFSAIALTVSDGGLRHRLILERFRHQAAVRGSG